MGGGSRKGSVVLVGSLLAACVAMARVAPAQAGGTELSGHLNVVWDCGEGYEGHPSYSLAEDSGRTVPLELDDEARHALGEGPAAGRAVMVRGVTAPSGAAEGLAAPLRVQFLQSEPGESAAAPEIASGATGTQPFAMILLRFSDTAGSTPESPAYFQKLLSDRAPGLGSYFRQISYGKVSLQGSRVFGWYTLPYPRRSYLSGGQFDLEKVALDAADVARRDVTFSRFAGLSLVFNVKAFGDQISGFGGQMWLDLDGQKRRYGMSWITCYQQAAVAHEFGHSLGLPHSSGPYGQTYDSHWDVMSYPYLRQGGDFGYLAEGTISHHRDILGWIGAEQKFVAEPGTQATITLQSLSGSGSGGYLMARLPLDADGRRSYTVEVRQKDGCDQPLPGAGVIIHSVDTGRTRPAQVVDRDGDGNPNDAGATWDAGQIFTDAANNVQISVLQASGGACTVSIVNGALPPTALAASYLPDPCIRLSWRNQCVGAQGVEVERAQGGSGFKQIAKLPAGATTYDDRDVVAEAAYTYRVRVVRATCSAVSDTVTVTAAMSSGRLQFTPRVNFGKVRRGQSGRGRLLLRNVSRTQPLRITLGSVLAPFASLSAKSASIVIPPRGSYAAPLTFTPARAGAAHAYLVVRSSDPSHSSSRAGLAGRGL